MKPNYKPTSILQTITCRERIIDAKTRYRREISHRAWFPQTANTAKAGKSRFCHRGSVMPIIWAEEWIHSTPVLKASRTMPAKWVCWIREVIRISCKRTTQDKKIANISALKGNKPGIWARFWSATEINLSRTKEVFKTKKITLRRWKESTCKKMPKLVLKEWHNRHLKWSNHPKKAPKRCHWQNQFQNRAKRYNNLQAHLTYLTTPYQHTKTRNSPYAPKSFSRKTPKPSTKCYLARLNLSTARLW